MKKIYTFGLKSLIVALAKKQTFKKVGFVAGLLLTFGMTAFSQTNFYVRYDSLTKAKAIVKNKLDLPAYWTSDSTGMGGTSPVDFTTPGQIFNVQASGYSVNAPLVISGAGSKLVVGTDTSTATITFTLSNIAAFTGTVDIMPFSTANQSPILVINQANISTITLGTLGTGSTVRYAGNLAGSVQQVIATNYYNLSLAATAATYATVALPAKAIGIAGLFTPRLSSLYGSTIDFNGTGGQTIPAGTYYNLTLSGNKTVSDSLKGAINIAGAFTDNSTGAPVVSYVITNTKGVIAQAGSTLNFLGLNPQSVGNDKTLFNVSFSDGIQLPVTAISGNTITLAQANGDLKVGQKINTNIFSATTIRNNNILLDTTATITAISDTVITFDQPIKLRFFIANGTSLDTVYATGFDAASQTITLDPSINYDSLATATAANPLIIRGAVLSATTSMVSIVGNVVTVNKPLINIDNLGIVSIGNPSSKPATKTITGTLRLIGIGTLASTVPLVTDGSTVSYEGSANRIGGSPIWAYNNLTVNQQNQTSAVVSSQAFINGILSILSGKVTSTSSSRGITLNENATFPSPATDSCYVSTPLAKVFTSTTPFTYYLGGSYKGFAQPRKVILTPKTAEAKTYSVGFYPSKIPNFAKIDITTIKVIDTVSNYNVVVYGHAAGIDTSAQITFQFDPTLNPADSYKDSSLVLARYNGSKYTAVSAPVIFNGTLPFNLTTAGYDTAFGRYTFATVGSILVPVKLSGVTAIALVNKTIKINWSSANELSVGKYIVEGSVDGVKFSTKGTLTAKGSSNYSFVDATPSAGINYYRIKAIDIDGKVSYSTIVSAKQILAGTISIVNPVKNKQLSFVLSTDAANYTLKVTNVLGQSILSKTIAHNGGTSTYSVSLPSSALAGTYFVQLTSSNNQSTKTIIVE